MQLLKSCLHAERVQRPKVDEVAERLHQAAQAMASGEFDVFLSHKWGRDGMHAPLTTQVYQALLAAGLRVWLDTAEMGFDMNVSMESGIARSGCVVALLNARYGTALDKGAAWDPAQDNCLKELRLPAWLTLRKCGFPAGRWLRWWAHTTNFPT